jgi:ATP-dependent RNA helicase DDX3X
MSDAGNDQAFDVTAMGNAITDVVKDDSAPQSFLNVEAAALAREKGWAIPQEYDYKTYNSTEKEKPKPAEPVEIAEGEENAKGAEGTKEAVIAEPEWASGAAKYEWSDEYGDIGPPNPELEKMLFHNELFNRAGLKFDQ